VDRDQLSLLPPDSSPEKDGTGGERK